MITSRTNQFVSHIKQLNTSKKYRHKHYQIVLETERTILDTITHRSTLIDYILTTSKHTNIIKLAEQNNIKLIICNDDCASYCAHVHNCIGCFAVVNFPRWELNNKPHNLAICIASITNPANLGSILRNAHAFGCDVIYRFGNSCDLLHPECVRASAGNIFSIPIYDLKEDDISRYLKQYNCWALDSNSHTTISEIKTSKHLCFIFGSEIGFKSMPIKLSNTCQIPMHNNVDSLNVAATSAIILHTFSKLASN